VVVFCPHGGVDVDPFISFKVWAERKKYDEVYTWMFADILGKLSKMEFCGG
jgi:hypothetical protein